MEILVKVLTFIAIIMAILTFWELVKVDAKDVFLDIKTHPKSDMVCSTIGDSIYMIGGGIVGASAYELISHDNFLFFPSAIGFSLILLGALMRNHYSRKAK